MIDDSKQHVELYSSNLSIIILVITLLCLDVDIIGPLKEKWREAT